LEDDTSTAVTAAVHCVS